MYNSKLCSTTSVCSTMVVQNAESRFPSVELYYHCILGVLRQYSEYWRTPVPCEMLTPWIRKMLSEAMDYIIMSFVGMVTVSILPVQVVYGSIWSVVKCQEVFVRRCMVS